MARCNCNDGPSAGPTSCGCSFANGVNTLVSGTGTVSDPFKVSATTSPSGVRDALSAGPGLAFNTLSGEFRARRSSQVNNKLVFGDDGGLFVSDSPDNPQVLTAGANTTVTGTGATTDPWVVNALTNVSEVRAAFSSGIGTIYDPAAGKYNVNISTQPGNTLVDNAGLFVPAAAPTVVQAGPNHLGTGITVTGAGTPASPYIVAQAAPHRTYQLGDDFTETLTLTVPAAVPTAPSRSRSFTFTNPDPLRSVLVRAQRELTLTFDLPVGTVAAPSRAAGGLSAADIDTRFNNGAAQTGVRIFSSANGTVSTSLAPGASVTITVDAYLGKGLASAALRRAAYDVSVVMTTI